LTANFFASAATLVSSVASQGIIAMSGNFCKRTERRLEKPGLEKEESRRFAGLVQRDIDNPDLNI